MNTMKATTAAVLLFALAASGCLNRIFADRESSESGQNERRVVDTGEEFELDYGETVAVKGTNLELTFSFVSNDSRCPSDVTCIWQGEAVVLFSVNGKDVIGYQAETRIPGLTPTPYYDNQTVELGDLTLRLLRLSPYPVEAHHPEAKEYQALVVIEP